jgi:NAD(P)-dependent dehydrogenase (short-subunit alcohol dehydrogenase family)
MILKDKVVIITGAGPGMGQAMCRGAAAEGAKVAVSARSVAAIEAIVADIKAAGGEAIAVPTDVSDTAQCQNLAAQTLKAFGRIDGLVNSAYFHPPWSDLEHAAIDDVAQAFNVNALGGLRMVQAVLPQMRKQGSGSIVNISTLATRKPMRGEGGYAMAKAALTHMHRPPAQPRAAGLDGRRATRWLFRLARPRWRGVPQAARVGNPHRPYPARQGLRQGGVFLPVRLCERDHRRRT